MTHTPEHRSAFDHQHRPQAIIRPRDRADAARILTPSMLMAAPELEAYIIDLVQTRLTSLPLSIIQGYRQSTWSFDEEEPGTDRTTTATSYGDLAAPATVGPSLTGLSNGVYQVMFGFTGYNGNNTHKVYMSVATDTEASSDNYACLSEGNGGTPTQSHMRAVKKTLTSGDDNTITCQYRVTGGTGHAMDRWLMAQWISEP